MKEAFRRWAQLTSERVGSAWAFGAAIVLIALWAALGPVFHFSDTWQLVVNTATTIVTFLMVFVIQNTQNRDAKAIQLKLDELLRGVKGARTRLVHLEEWTDEEIAELEQQFARLRHRLADGERKAPKA